MENQKMFEVATRSKMRFPFKGLISVEDLWDLSVKSLDLVYKSLNSELKQVQEESLLDIKTESDKELDLKIEIIRYIVGVKLEEEKSRLKSKEQKEQKQKILEVLAAKQDQELNNKSVEELQAILNRLDS